MNWIITRGT